LYGWRECEWGRRIRSRKSARPIRAANYIYFAREENVRRKVTDEADSPRDPSRNLIADQKTKIVSSALYIFSKSDDEEVSHSG